MSSAAMAPRAGDVYLAEPYDDRVRVIKPPLPDGSGDLLVASRDGREVYCFDENGRHLNTTDAVTGALRYRFHYTAAGQLEAVEDANGGRTVIERDGQGRPTAILAPFGQRTELTTNAQGYLETIRPTR